MTDNFKDVKMIFDDPYIQRVYESLDTLKTAKKYEIKTEKQKEAIKFLIRNNFAPDITFTDDWKYIRRTHDLKLKICTTTKKTKKK